MAIHASSFSDETRIQPPHSSICWEWSIRPMIILLRIIGVDLPGCSAISSAQRNRRWLILVYRIFCFLCHISSRIHILHYWSPMLLIALFHNQTDDAISYLDSSATAKWNMIIDLANYLIHDIGIHLILLTFIRAQWVNTMEIFQRLNVIFTAENYILMRKISFGGVIYVILLVI